MEGILAPWHWAILIVVILLVFGPRKLPELGNSLGKSINSFKRGLTDMQGEISTSMAEADPDEPTVSSQSFAAQGATVNASDTQPQTQPQTQSPTKTQT